MNKLKNPTQLIYVADDIAHMRLEGMCVRRLTHLLFSRSRLEYLIVCTAYLLLVSNVFFAANSLTEPTGTIEIDYGSEIPQEINQTVIKNTLASPVLEGIILNVTPFNGQYYFKCPLDNISRIQYNLTLRSTDSPSEVAYDVVINGHTRESIEVEVGLDWVTLSLEPAPEDIGREDYWVSGSSLYVRSDSNLEYGSLIVWAEFSAPRCPVSIDIRSTCGVSLFSNKYMQYMGSSSLPQLTLHKEGIPSSNRLQPRQQNQTYFLYPGNYTGEIAWGYSDYTSNFIEHLNLSLIVSANESAQWIIHLQVVQLELEIYPDLPLVNIMIDPSDYWYGNAYQLVLDSDELQITLYLPPYQHSAFEIQISSIDLLSSRIAASHPIRSISINSRIPMNGTRNIILKVYTPYISILGVAMLPQDIYLVTLSLFLFALILTRLALHYKSKKLQFHWNNPRLIPIYILIVTSLLPWFSATNIDEAPRYHDTVQLNSVVFGAFPLVGIWTKSNVVTLALTSNGFIWALGSLIMIWIPLIYAINRIQGPYYLDNDGHSVLLPFLPFIFSLFLCNSIGDEVSGLVTISPFVQGILLIAPILWLIAIRDLVAVESYPGEQKPLVHKSPVIQWNAGSHLTDKVTRIAIFGILLLILYPTNTRIYGGRVISENFVYGLFEFFLYLVQPTYYFYQAISWLIISVPYIVLSYIAIAQLWRYGKNRKRIVKTGLWIALPVVSMILSAYAMNILTILTSGFYNGPYYWYPLPVSYLALLIIVILILGTQLASNTQIEQSG